MPPRWSRTSASKASKMSIEGWWMVTITVRPLRDTFFTLCITIAAARASRPACTGADHQIHPLACFFLGRTVDRTTEERLLCACHPHRQKLLHICALLTVHLECTDSSV